MPSPVAGSGETTVTHTKQDTLRGAYDLGVGSGGDTTQLQALAAGDGHEQGKGSRVQGAEGLCLLCRAFRQSLAGTVAVGRGLKMTK